MGDFVLFGLGLAAGTLAGVIGTGSSLILLPLLVVMHGPKAAVPIMAIASVMANFGRILAWFRDIDRRVLLFYSLGSVPCAVLGARTLIAIPAWTADVVLGLFFFAVIFLRRRVVATQPEPGVKSMLACGAGVGFLTGLVQSTGPLSVVVFTSFGMRLGRLLATESAASLLIYGTKTSTFSVLGVITRPLLLQGLFIGSSLMIGAFLGKRIVRRIGERRFNLLLDLVIGVNALIMLVSAAREYAAG